MHVNIAKLIQQKGTAGFQISPADLSPCSFYSEADCVRTTQVLFLRESWNWNGERVQKPECGERKYDKQRLKNSDRGGGSTKVNKKPPHFVLIYTGATHATAYVSEWFWFTAGLPHANLYRSEWVWFPMGLPHAISGSECRITSFPLSLNSADTELLAYFHVPVELFSASISWNEREEEGKAKKPQTQPDKLWACSFANKPALPQRPRWVCSNVPCSFV